MAMDKAQFRRTAGLFATGVTVVTTTWGSATHGMTANSFTSVSLDPTLILISVDNTAYLHELLPQSRIFAVSILSAAQEHLSRFFATAGHRGQGEFDGIQTKYAETGAPIIVGAMGYLDCRVVSMIPAGDHTLYVGEVVAMGIDEVTKPLIFYRGRYWGLDDD